MVVFHRQRDNAAVQVRLVRVTETVVGRTVVQQRRQRRGVVTARRHGRPVVRHQHGILRLARLQLRQTHDDKYYVLQNVGEKSLFIFFSRSIGEITENKKSYPAGCH